MDRTQAEAILGGDRETAIALLMRLDELIEANRRLEARVADLERQLHRTSRNSSLPPSQDPPSAPPRPQKPQSDRSPGGQPGHEGKNRTLFPLGEVDEIVDHWPERCHTCTRPFAPNERVDVAPPQRHQVSELPPIAVAVTEHRLHRLRCPQCAQNTRAQLPGDVPRGAFGPCLQAAVVTLAIRNRVSRRDTVELLRELFGAQLSTGAVDAIICRAGEALAESHDELLRCVRGARSVNIDETGWRTAGARRTLWGVLTARQALFHIAPDRHRREAEALLGPDFAGVACSDRWWAYDYLDPERRQLCWAHIIRDFTAHSEGPGAQKHFGLAGLEIAERMFGVWDEFRRDGDRPRLLERVGPLKEELRTLLTQATLGSAKTKRYRIFAGNLLKRWPALWTFTTVPGVEPTNNHAERGLRGAVIYRKLSLGSQSEQGEHTIERLLSASVTCRLQGRSLFAYLTDVLNAKIRGDPIPLLG
jgi:transposase